MLFSKKYESYQTYCFANSYKNSLRIWLFWKDFAKSQTRTFAFLLSCPDRILHDLNLIFLFLNLDKVKDKLYESFLNFIWISVTITNFSCMFRSPNIFFPIWLVLIYHKWETSRSNLKNHCVTKNSSDLALFE